VDLTINVDQTPLLVDHRKHDPVIEEDKLFAFQAKLREGAEPGVQEGTNCRPSFENLQPPVKGRIGSEEAHHRVDVMLIDSLEGKGWGNSGLCARWQGLVLFTVGVLPIVIAAVLEVVLRISGRRPRPRRPSPVSTPRESLRIDVDHVEDLGDAVLALFTFHGKGRGSGAEVTLKMANVAVLA